MVWLVLSPTKRQLCVLSLEKFIDTAVPGITGLTITIPIGQRVHPLPDGDRYLGFIFAQGDSQQDVEKALTGARERLRVVIDD